LCLARVDLWFDFVGASPAPLSVASLLLLLAISTYRRMMIPLRCFLHPCLVCVFVVWSASLFGCWYSPHIIITASEGSTALAALCCELASFHVTANAVVAVAWLIGDMDIDA
jgi:hypothetical protein